MYVRVNGIDVYYETLGEGNPLLMIHGFGIDSTVMKRAFEPVFDTRASGGISGVVSANFMRVYFDLPGMGKTDKTFGIDNADDMLDLIVRFKDTVISNSSFSVIGYSYGGYLARGLLRREFEGITGMFLFAPVIYPAKEDRTLPTFKVLTRDSRINEILKGIKNKESEGKRSFSGVDESKAFEKFVDSVVVQNEYTWRRYLKEVYPGLLRVDRGFLRRYQSRGYSFSFDPDELERPFRNPVLVLTGRQDSVVGYMDSFKLMQNYPRGSFVVLDMAGHNLQIERYELFEALFLDWLKRVYG